MEWWCDVGASLDTSNAAIQIPSGGAYTYNSTTNSGQLPNMTVASGGTVTASVVAAGGTQLHVRVPATAITGNVTVTIGATTSNALVYKTP